MKRGIVPRHVKRSHAVPDARWRLGIYAFEPFDMPIQKREVRVVHVVEREIGPFGCFVRKKGTLKVVLLYAEMLGILHTDSASFKETISGYTRQQAEYSMTTCPGASNGRESILRPLDQATYS